MFLRKTIEGHLDVREGEKRLSNCAAEFAFRGFYLINGNVVDAYSEKNISRPTKDTCPYVHVVVRSKDGYKHRSGDGIDSPVYKSADDAAVRELHDPQVLARVNRVEGIARRLKLSASGLLIAGVASFVGVEAASGGPAHPVNHHETTSAITDGIRNCGDIIDGTQSLIPLSVHKVEAAQKLGETVCTVNSYDFVVSN